MKIRGYFILVAGRPETEVRSFCFLLLSPVLVPPSSIHFSLHLDHSLVGAVACKDAVAVLDIAVHGRGFGKGVAFVLVLQLPGAKVTILRFFQCFQYNSNFLGFLT